MKTVAEHFNRDPLIASQVITKAKQELIPDWAVQQTITTLEEVLTRTGKREYLFTELVHFLYGQKLFGEPGATLFCSRIFENSAKSITVNEVSQIQT